jgi:hypothetical protein
MSTYYYLGCYKCRECVPFWARGPGGAGLMASAVEQPETVQDFLEVHLKHGVQAFDEHDERNEQYSDFLDRYR